MKTAKRLLSIVLTLCMVIGLFPANLFGTGAVKALATDGYDENDHMNDRTDIDMDFDYPYTSPDVVLRRQANVKQTVIPDKNGTITWKHIASFGPASGDLKNKLQSTDESDTYLILDKDLSTTSAHTDFNTIVIKSNKVLDLHGHSITLFDKRNKVDTHDDYFDSYYQSNNSADFQTVMFSIQSGATLTIIDSSPEKTGEIYINAYMINPYAHRIKRYTTRDLFDVSDGNLVIYDGTFQAGRSKAQSDDDLFSKITTVIGNATLLATDIAGYATGINSATGAYEDAVFNAKQAMDAIKKDTSEEGSKTQTNATTEKKDGSDAKKETKTDSPTSEASGDSGGRNKTVGEKQEDKDKNKKNESNKNGTAQYDGNSKIAAAENAIVNAATSKDQISSMVNSALNLATSIKACFETNEGSIVTQSFLGTVVNVGNAGTFVSYGGTYIGYGMTPNIRNGVIECTSKGKAYIYGGTFEGRCGANIFNIVSTNNNAQLTTQFVQGTNGVVKETPVYMNADETNGVQVLSMVNKTDDKGNLVYDDDGNVIKVPVNTSNIRVRGGTFRCYYEGVMVGLNEDSKEGAYDHNSDKMTVFPGSSGGVNLGVESYNEDLIRDGRIQLVDSYGDGALVLMDDDKEAGNRSIFHYRLFCTDEELRKNRYLVVYPNEADSNSTYSFSLQTRYGGQDASNFDDVSKYWSNDGENDRGVFSSDEKFFTYPINDKDLSEKYYVIPYMSNTDVFGENLDTSEVWYYNTPTDTRNRKIESFTYAYTSAHGTVNSGGTTYQGYCRQPEYSDSDWNKIEKKFVSGQCTFKDTTENYRNNVKWITYKVYRVDPLTRENVTTKFGVDQPVVEVCYGAASDTALKCRLPLHKLGIQYQPGEMYRVVMNVEEHLCYDGTWNKLDTAKCESSIVFMCYDTNEYKTENNTVVEDFTPVQWINEPKSGSEAMVQIVNGQAGKVDCQHRKIFDVYYQWYEVNPDGNDILIAGTDNIYTTKKDEYTADLAGLRAHNFRQMLPGQDGFTYVNTVNPDDPMASTYASNGLPSDTSKWTVQMLHSYIESNTPNEMLTKNSQYEPTPQNNNAMATGTDRCYIPESCEGKTIYCKVTAVNSFWMRNYDHVQVFYSHKVKVPVNTKPLEVSMDLTYSGKYLTKDNQAVLKLSEVKNLDPDEKITKVEFKAKRGGAKTVTLDNLNVTSATSVKSVTWPKDFYESSSQYDWIPAYSNMQFSAIVYTNKDRIKQSNVSLADYEVEAQDLNFNYHGYYYYGGIYHHTNDAFVNEMSIDVTPHNASIGYEMMQGASFTSSDPDVASFDAAGRLVPGTKEGQTTITLNTPKGETKTLVYANPIQKVEVSGVDAPVDGEVFDTDAIVPADANYQIKEVYWTKGKYGDRIPEGSVAEKYRSYTAHVVVEEKNGQEFMTDDYNFLLDGEQANQIVTPYVFKATLADGTIDTEAETYYGDDEHAWMPNRRNTIELTYTFPSDVADGSNVIDTVIINFDPDVKEGDDIAAWKEQTQVITAAGDAIDITKRIDNYAQGDTYVSPYGYTASKLGVFMKGVQRGFTAELRVPNGLDITIANNLTVIVNGDDTYECEINNQGTLAFISLYDVFHMEGETELAPMPVVNIDNAYLAVGESLNVEELVHCDEAVEITLSQNANYAQYYESYPETNVIKAVKSTNNKSMTMFVDVKCDANGDGIFDTAVPVSAQVFVYDTADQIPDIETRILNVTEIAPDGTTFYTGKRYFDENSSPSFSIPEVENAFITSIEASAGNFYIKQGAEMISQSIVRENRSITVRSVAADTLKISAGADEAYAYFDNLNVKSLNVSVDGIHFRGNGHIDGLEPNTEYTLYYKQGISGTVYSKSFKTAGFEYGVSVGQNMVTDQNTGNLEKDGWHYDASEGKLTIRDLSLKSVGIVAETEDWAGYEMPVYAGAIASEGDLILELAGDNELGKFTGDSLYDPVIYTRGNLTLEGEGNLTLTGVGGISARGIYSKGNVVLDSVGTVTFHNCMEGVDISDYTNGSVTYKNGEYYMLPDLYNSLYIGSMVDSRINLILNSTHTLSATMGYTEDAIEENTVAAEDIKDGMQGQLQDASGSYCFLHVKPVHSCTKKVQAAAYYVDGDCEEGATYYKSCACGYTDKQSTFIVGGQEHDYEYHDAKEATCIEDGWKAYKVCTKCGKTDFEAVPATGHAMTHYDAKEATCIEAGWNDYSVCEKCGLSTKEEIPAKGHTLIHHDGQAPTCTAPGFDDYDTCTDCDYSTYQEMPKTEHSLIHHEGKEATDKESGYEAYDECENCDYNTFKVIPVKVLKGTWKKDAKGWWYRNPDGTYPKNQWKKIDGKWYHFDANGYMQTGWYQEGKYYYYLKANGVMAVDEWVENDKYYVDANGHWVKGKTKETTGTWKKDSKGWWYRNPDGTYPKNQWKKIGTKWYHFDANGYMQTGWFQEGKYYYYLKQDGAMAVDEWVDNDKYYVDANGHWVKGAKKE